MERKRIAKLFTQLDRQPRLPFPQTGYGVAAPKTHGVYVIRDRSNNVVHVGRTFRGRNGLFQRLCDHLLGQSSFVGVHLKGDGRRLRTGYTFQFIEVSDDRQRALLESYATAWHCPAHLGVGARRVNGSNKT